VVFLLGANVNLDSWAVQHGVSLSEFVGVVSSTADMEYSVRESYFGYYLGDILDTLCFDATWRAIMSCAIAKLTTREDVTVATGRYNL
jgi:hypothetical protein